MDFDSEEDSRGSLSPKLTVEVLGVSEWDGKGRVNNYPGGILLVTHTGSTYYISCVSVEERDEWMLHFRKALECVFANTAIAPYKPSKLTQNRPALKKNTTCPKTGNIITSYSPLCRSCGRSFYSSAEVLDSAVFIQFASEEPEKICLDCKNAQLCVLWLKIMSYVHTIDLHELTPLVMKDVSKFKATFKLHRRCSQRLDMAASLYENGNLTPEEFEELRSVDHAYRREVQYDECLKLKHALEAFAEDMQTIINVLMNDSMTAAGGRNAYFTIILHILELSDNAPDLVDFFFPQLYQVHLLLLLSKDMEAYKKLDCLQQLLLVISQKYPSFGLKLAWNLLATIGDYHEKRVTQIQFAASVCLLLQLEMVMAGEISVIADIPMCIILSRVLRPAEHQKQEIGFDTSALFLIRRKLQEAYDDEERERRQRNIDLYGDSNPDLAEDARIAALKAAEKKSFFPGANKIASGLELLHQLGVGQARKDSDVIDDNSNHSNEHQLERKAKEIKNTIPKAASHSSINTLDTASGNSQRHGRHLHHWDGFCKQLDFVARINSLVDSLRNIDRPLRSDVFKKEVDKWNHHKAKPRTRRTSVDNKPLLLGFGSSLPSDSQLDASHEGLSSSDKLSDLVHIDPLEKIKADMAYIGWDPTVIAGEPQYKIINILSEECRVFRTKARAPTLVVCEVMRDDLFEKYGPNIPSIDEDIYQPKQITNALASNNEEVGLSIDRLDDTDVGKLRSINISERDTSGSMAKIAPHTVVGNRAKADSFEINSATGVNHQKESVARKTFDSIAQSIQDVDLVLETSLNPALAELHSSHSQTGATSQELPPPPHNSLENEDKPFAAIDADQTEKTAIASTKMNSPAPDSDNKFLRRKSGAVLPANRLATSTEGILRSSQMTSTSSLVPSEIVRIKTSAVNQHISSDFAGHGQDHPKVVFGAADPSKAGASLKQPIRKPGVHPSTSSGQLSDSSDITRDDNSVLSNTNTTISAEDAAAMLQVHAHVISSAQRLLQEGLIDQHEYEQLLLSDHQFREEVAREEAVQAKSRVEVVMGESFRTKKERILGKKNKYFQLVHAVKQRRQTQQRFLESAPDIEKPRSSSPQSLSIISSEGDDSDGETESLAADNAYWPAFDLRAFIIKTNDDLRQEICCLQLMQIFKEIFDHFGLSNMLFLKPYRIVCTGYSCGVVEVLSDAVSIDALKKTPGYTTLSAYFSKVYDTSPERLANAKINFMSSLAAYSLFSYLLQIKDRHNGNLLLDSEGHILHIDFGFLLSIAPGGSFSLETAPFKLTEEMVDLLGGLDSALFGDFVTAFTKGFIALQANCENIISAITVLSHNSTFPCFHGKPVGPILDKLRSRFRSELNVKDAVAHCLDLITNSYGHYGTRQYDVFQYYSNGILP